MKLGETVFELINSTWRERAVLRRDLGRVGGQGLDQGGKESRDGDVQEARSVREGESGGVLEENGQGDSRSEVGGRQQGRRGQTKAQAQAGGEGDQKRQVRGFARGHAPAGGEEYVVLSVGEHAWQKTLRRAYAAC